MEVCKLEICKLEVLSWKFVNYFAASLPRSLCVEHLEIGSL